MVQIIKAYKNMETNPKSLQKQHGHKHKKYWITSLTINKPMYHKFFKTDPRVLNQNNNPSNTARQNQEFIIEYYK